MQELEALAVEKNKDPMVTFVIERFNFVPSGENEGNHPRIVTRRCLWPMRVNFYIFPSFRLFYPPVTEFLPIFISGSMAEVMISMGKVALNHDLP